MPPTFRSSRSGRQFNDGPNRTRTGQIDHDVFEGLPVRRWSRQVQTISQEPKTEGPESDAPGHAGNSSIPEHPMPRDSHLLSPMSRALLRAARSGCSYIRKASKDYDDGEKDVTDVDEQQTQQNLERNFSMRKWTTVPKHLEAPEVEFLAKRRPGLPSLYGATAGTVENANVPMRKTRFKKVDSVTGNISVYAAWVPEGHKIEGEIADDSQLAAENNQVTVTPQAPAPGTVIEGVGVVNAQGVVVAEAGSAAVLTPPRRRPPPPKRKGKSLKGRRKKVMFAPGEGADASLVHGAGVGAGGGTGKETNPSRMSVDQTTQDDEDDEGEEGEESDDGEGEESGFDAKTPETPSAQPSTEPEPEPTPISATEILSTPVPIKSEVSVGSQSPQVPSQELKPEPDSAAESLSIPAHSVAPTSPENPPAVPASATPLDQPTKTTAVAPMAEDVDMTDAVPTEDTVRPSIPASETKLQATSELPQPVLTEKGPSPPQDIQQPAASESPNVAAVNAGPPTSKQSEGPMDVTIGEPSESYPKPTPVGLVSMDLSTETSQPQVEQTAGKDPISQETDQQPSGNGFDLLDNLEASLSNAPKIMRSEEQKEVVPEHKSELPNLESAPEREPAAPQQLPTEAPAETTHTTCEDPVAPPVEQLTPPEAEQTGALSAQQRRSPLTQLQKPENASGAPTQPETHSSGEPTAAPETAQAQTLTEQPEQASQESVLEQTTSEPPAQPEVTAEPPTAQEPSQQLSSEAATEQQEQKRNHSAGEQGQGSEAISECVTQPAAKTVVEAAAEPVSEPVPVPASISPLLSESAPEQPQPATATRESPEEAVQPQAEPLGSAPSEPAQEHGTSHDGPSANGEQHSQ